VALSRRCRRAWAPPSDRDLEAVGEDLLLAARQPAGHEGEHLGELGDIAGCEAHVGEGHLAFLFCRVGVLADPVDEAVEQGGPAGLAAVGAWSRWRMWIGRMNSHGARRPGLIS
jgi:hypothetical protein